jgi:hypothetical protein
MAVIRKKVHRAIRRTRSRSSKIRHLTPSSGGFGNSEHQMDAEALLAAESIFVMYDKAESRARSKAKRGEVWQADLGLAAKARPVLIIGIPESDDRQILPIFRTPPSFGERSMKFHWRPAFSIQVGLMLRVFPRFQP